MKIEKAIKINTTLTKHGYWSMTPVIFDAIQLGIEALKGIKEHRKWPMSISLKHLPSETED